MEHLLNSNYWEEGDLLGRGSFGDVYLYTYVKTNHKIAAKQVKFNNNDKNFSNDMKQITNEIDKLRVLSHERIITYLGSHRDDKKFIMYVCLEYMSNGSLYQIVPLNLCTTIKYTRQILEGVVYLHQQGIIHRDIKGSNILIDEHNNIKLADFGIARQLKSLQSTQGTAGVGTNKWMAPEMMKGEKYGLKVDIWSIGCIVVEMLTGHPPWKDLNEYMTISKVCSGEYPIYDLQDLRFEVEEFLHQCLQVDPKKRSSAADLLTANLCKLSVAGELR